MAYVYRVRVMRLLILLFLLPSAIQAQNSIDEFIQEINFKDDTLQAVFSYITTNISYDPEFAGNIPEYHSYDEVLQDALDNKKGVCMHYAALFNAVCAKLGFESYIISGYTKFYNQPVAALPHAWNAVRIKDEWFMFDPTWAAGYLLNGKFQPHYDPVWYKRSPEEFIYSHIPFDPLWQFRSKASTHEEIAQNNYSAGGIFFMDHNALLQEFNSAGELEKLELSLDRIKKARPVNDLILNKIRFMEEQVDIHRHNQQVYALSAGHKLLRAAKKEFEDYLLAKRQFFKQWTDKEVAGSLRSFEVKVKEAQSLFTAADVSDDSLKKHKKQSLQQTNKLLDELEREEQFVQKYLKTWKPVRFINFL